MSVHHDGDRDRWVVRWREAGRQRGAALCRRGGGASVRRAGGLAPAQPAAERGHGGVYAYETTDGPRWRYVFRQSDGRLTSRRGFTSRAAAVHARATAVELVRCGEVRASRETFGEFWAALVQAKRPYVTAGTLQDHRVHGDRRLLPWFGALKLAAVDEDRVRDWLAEMAERVADRELSAKTVQQRPHVPVDDARRGGSPAAHPAEPVPPSRKTAHDWHEWALEDAGLRDMRSCWPQSGTADGAPYRALRDRDIGG